MGPPTRDLDFPLIDVLRGFAAVSVLMAHAIFLFHWDAFPRTGVLAWFRIGFWGIDLFFVISGFVIGLSAFASLDRDPPAFRGRFIRRRLRRIEPLSGGSRMDFISGTCRSSAPS